MDFPEIAKGEERRLDVRHDTELPAYFLIGADSFPVTIRDYSTNGLFVAFGKAPPPSERVQGWVGVSAVIDAAQSAVAELAAGASIETVAVEPIAVRVVHAVRNGLGIHVDRLPAEWVSTLQTAAKRKTQPVPADGREFASLIERCLTVYCAFAKQLGDEALARAMDRLGALEGSDPFTAAKSGFDAARVALSAQREAVVQRFVENCRVRVNSTIEPEETLEQPVSVDQLRLMEADELDDYLSLSKTIKRVDEKVAIALDQFEMRYARLTGAAVLPKKSAMGPEKTIRGFHGALGNLTLSPPSARVLITELEHVALARFPALLQDLNQMLASAPRAERVRRTAATRAANTPTTFAASLLPQAIPDSNTQELVSSLQQKYSAGRASAPSRALNVINDLVHDESGKIAEKGLTLNDGSATGREVSLDELLATIGELPPSTGSAFAQAGPTEVLAAMQTREGANSAKHGSALPVLSAQHQSVLDTSARLFRQASQDFVPNGDVEQLMKRLEQTLLKLSLRDGEFPSSPEHPARKVVNLIDQYHCAADDKGLIADKRLRANLEALVKRICDQADIDPAVFDVVQHSLEQDLEGLRRERRERINRIVEALESRDSIRTVRDEVDLAFMRRLASRRVPRAMLRLLDDVWRQHSVVIGLRHGLSSDQWRNNWSLIERALSLSIDTVDDGAALQLRGEVFRELAAVLSELVSDLPLRDQLLIDLEALMVRADPQQVADVIEAPKFVDPSPLSAASTAAVKDESPKPQNLRLGDWYEMQVQGAWVSVQLVWLSQRNGFAGFVNRSATNRLEMTVSDFNKQLGKASARSRASLDLPLLDRSEFALLGDAYAGTVKRNDVDATNGMLTRRGLQRRLTDLAAQAGGGNHHVFALIEFDEFRTISSTCGFEAVEMLSGKLTTDILKRLPQGCFAALYREDTYAIVLPNYTRSAGLRTISEIAEKLADYHFTHAQHSFRIGVSAGVTDFGSGQVGSLEVMRHADAACLAAKGAGRNRVQEYLPSKSELREEEALMAWAGHADALLGSDELYLRAQLVLPIAPNTQDLPYYEILLGIRPIGGVVTGPYNFIVALERMGRAHELDLWVMRTAFRWITENWMILESIAGIAINLSASSLRNPEITEFLRQELTRGAFPASKIIFEITETAAIRDYEGSEQFIRELHRYGARLSLDDFGSGFTSYGHLRNLSTDTLKIDGSYVKDLLNNASDLAIVKSMTDIAHTLGMKVVAEWVESTAILEKLIELGVDYGQGFAIHKPVRLSDLVATTPQVAAKVDGSIDVIA